MKCFFYEARYAGVQCSLVVVPFEGDADVFASAPVNRDGVMFLEGLFEMIGMLFADKFVEVVPVGVTY